MSEEKNVNKYAKEKYTNTNTIDTINIESNEIEDTKMVAALEKTKDMSNEEIVAMFNNLKNNLKTIEDLESLKTLVLSMSSRGINLPKIEKEKTKLEAYLECLNYLPGERPMMTKEEHAEINKWIWTLDNYTDEDLIKETDKLMAEIFQQRAKGTYVNWAPKYRLEKLNNEMKKRGINYFHQSNEKNDDETPLQTTSNFNSISDDTFSNINNTNFDKQINHIR